MSMCSIFSCVVGRGCLLWPVCSLGKTLLAFAMLCFVLQGQICLLLQVSLDSYFAFQSPVMKKISFLGVSSRRSCISFFSITGWGRVELWWYWTVCLKNEQRSIQPAKTRQGADCVSDHELLTAKFRLKLKKVGKTTRPFRYDLNQIPYDYIVEMTKDSRD